MLKRVQMDPHLMKKQKIANKFRNVPFITLKSPKIATKKGDPSYFQEVLTERQRIKQNFGLTDKQLNKLFRGFSNKHLTAEHLTKEVVSRLDIFLLFILASDKKVYTLQTIRQFIRHRQIRVNGTIEKRPRFRLEREDQVTRKPFAKQTQRRRQFTAFAFDFEMLKTHLSR